MRTRQAGSAEGQARSASMRRTLPRSFYARPTLDVAGGLLGKVLVHRRRGVVSSGAIVEVEAYIGESDPACHAAPGLTRRNQPLYGAPGHAYLYVNYGIHCLFNVVTEPLNMPAAVLIRALEPIDGIAAMRRRRARPAKGRRAIAWRKLMPDDLCRGPGNLTVALGITMGLNGWDLLGDRIFIEDRGIAVGAVQWGPRIGISVGTDRPWRACIAGHPAVSRAAAAVGGRHRGRRAGT